MEKGGGVASATDETHAVGRRRSAHPPAITDFDDPLAMDINTALACLSGTAKHVMVIASTPESVDAIAQIAYALAESEAAFRAAPFL